MLELVSGFRFQVSGLNFRGVDSKLLKAKSFCRSDSQCRWPAAELTPETFFSANQHFFDDNFFLQCYDNYDSN